MRVLNVSELVLAGWKRETIIKGLGKNGNIRGDVTYVAPDSSNKFRQMSDVVQVINSQFVVRNLYMNCFFVFSTWNITRIQI